MFKCPPASPWPDLARQDTAMRWRYQPLLLLIANSTDSELAKQVEYLKAENRIPRKYLGKRPYLEDGEKR